MRAPKEVLGTMHLQYESKQFDFMRDKCPGLIEKQKSADLVHGIVAQPNIRVNDSGNTINE